MLLQLLEDISGFDREAHVTGQSEENPTYRSDRLFSVSTVVVVTILQVCLVAVTIVGRGIMGDIHTYLDLAETLTYYAPEYVTSAITLQISALATLLGRRFAIINSELEKLLESWNNPKVYARRTRTSGSKRTYSCLSKTELQEQLHSLRTKHYHLHAMSKSLNQRYTFQLSFVILRIFLDLVKNLLFFFVDRGFSSGVWISQSACLTLTIAMVQLLLIAFSCSSADSKLKATGPILHEIKNTDEHIDEDVRFFSVQILQYDFKITAMNVVTMNRPLITRVLAAVFSYVFLVMQLNLA